MAVELHQTSNSSLKIYKSLVNLLQFAIVTFEPSIAIFEPSIARCKEVYRLNPPEKIWMRNEDIFLAFALFLITDPHNWRSLVIVIVTVIDGKLVGKEISKRRSSTWSSGSSGIFWMLLRYNLLLLQVCSHVLQTLHNLGQHLHLLY